MIKFFQFGSCRTVFNKFNNENYLFQKNYDLTHTSKEIFTYLDLFDGHLNIESLPHPKCLMYHPEKFNAISYKKCLDESDIVIIEISSLKLINLDNIYYQINRERENRPRPCAIRINQTPEDLMNDIKKLEKRINKPILFFSHINSNFYDVETIEGYIDERQILDEIMEKNCKNYINVTKLFHGIDYRDIFCFKLKDKDTTHIKDSAKKIILQEIIKKTKEIL